MTKYNKYARELNEAFKEARKAYKEEAQVVAIAERFSTVGKTQAEQIVAQERLTAARSEFRHEANNIWREFSSKAQAIRDALSAEIERDNMANPADIDANALELIKTGMLSPAEYETLANTFANNLTMCKLLAHYADIQSKNAKDPHIGTKYSVIASELRTAPYIRLKDFDTLVDITNYCSGHGTQGEMNRSSYVIGMADKWEEFTADSIADF